MGPAPDLFSYRKFWAARFGAAPFLPMSRAEIVPDIPTLAEAGLANYDLALWFGMWARAGTPGAVVQKLNAQVNAVVQGKEVREQFGRIGIAAAPMKPEEFAKFVREQMGTFRRIAREANIPQQ